MIVLLDLEWIEKDGLHLTQLSALRADENWESKNELDIIVNPGSVCLRDRNHMALGGLSPVLYDAGVSEQDALLTFSEWLVSGDEVWVWAKSNLRLLGDLWVKWIPDMAFPQVYSMAEKARRKALRDRYDAASPYTMLARLKETSPFPEHRANNDVEAMRRLFQRMNLTRSADSEVRAAALPTQRESNQRMINKTNYNYLYLKNSGIFHTRTCKACLNAKHTGDILGSVYYQTASENRRPCKLCNPVPSPDLKYYLEQATAKRTESEQPSKEAPIISDEKGSELVKAKLLTGEVVQIKRKNVLGWCHHSLHKGAVNKSILEKHDCLGKNCPYLERNSESSFWLARQKEAEEKAKQKEKKRAAKAKESAQARFLLDLTNFWQSGLDKMDSDMYIVRIELETPRRYKVFYVSDNPFADGNRFPDFLSLAKASHPRYSINMRHIRDIDGHFVTRDEYFSRFQNGRPRA